MIPTGPPARLSYSPREEANSYDGQVYFDKKDVYRGVAMWTEMSSDKPDGAIVEVQQKNEPASPDYVHIRRD